MGTAPLAARERSGCMVGTCWSQPLRMGPGTAPRHTARQSRAKDVPVPELAVCCAVPKGALSPCCAWRGCVGWCVRALVPGRAAGCAEAGAAAWGPASYPGSASCHQIPVLLVRRLKDDGRQIPLATLTVVVLIPTPHFRTYASVEMEGGGGSPCRSGAGGSGCTAGAALEQDVPQDSCRLCCLRGVGVGGVTS